MRDVLAAYPALVRSATLVAATYRGRVVLSVLTGFFPLLTMAVWLTVVAEGGPPAGWTTGDFLSYYAAATLLWNLSGDRVVWQWDADMRSGDLSVRLLRPVHPFHQYATSDLGHRVVFLTVLAPALAIAALLVPGLDYPIGPVRLAAVAVALVLAYAVGLLMASTFALIGFWSTQTSAVWLLWWGLGSFTSGWVAPLALMPDWLRTAAVVLPFRTAMGFPIELLMGRLDARQTAYGFIVGLGWLAAFALLYRFAWRRGVRRYQAVAG
ncbi:ABC-2 family transporter protein [Dactylosporangium sp. AC04546]|uniref:ABC transporter permease n=1 Tax=Dactylosporangium sp. AC04546 TaxID=2862460 RepID=UPI001EE04718|nr:ABC-2 family transporter protein [Dactylosporangium sp. AC04546]WVK86901.1 ABC-2 family transporter protein [Dactylosporangium sp. AC04546]